MAGFTMSPTSLIALLPLIIAVSAKTDLAGCTTTDVSSPAGASVIYYVPDTYEICAPLDCGGGRAPAKTTVPGCAAYVGTATYSPSYLSHASSTAAPTVATTASVSSTGLPAYGHTTTSTITSDCESSTADAIESSPVHSVPAAYATTQVTLTTTIKSAHPSSTADAVKSETESAPAAYTTITTASTIVAATISAHAYPTYYPIVNSTLSTVVAGTATIGSSAVVAYAPTSSPIVGSTGSASGLMIPGAGLIAGVAGIMMLL